MRPLTLFEWHAGEPVGADSVFFFLNFGKHKKRRANIQCAAWFLLQQRGCDRFLPFKHFPSNFYKKKLFFQTKRKKGFFSPKRKYHNEDIPSASQPHSSRKRDAFASRLHVACMEKQCSGAGLSGGSEGIHGLSAYWADGLLHQPSLYANEMEMVNAGQSFDFLTVLEIKQADGALLAFEVFILAVR